MFGSENKILKEKKVEMEFNIDIDGEKLNYFTLLSKKIKYFIFKHVRILK